MLCYPSSWRDLRRRDNAGSGWLNKPEITPPPNSNHSSDGTSIGLHTGRVFVGNAGAGGHFIYGIVGDIANTASRIEQLNKQLGTRLLATEEVVSGLDDLLARPLGDYLLAGKRAAVSVVEILSPVAEASMAQLSLCARFERAIEAFREQQWEQAESHFRDILRDYPDDGPARFYLERRLPDVR